MAELAIAGRPASPGLASGPVHRLAGGGRERVASGDPAREAEALTTAIATALAQLEALAERTGGEAADMLAFQAALLSDEELSRPAFEAITRGTSADTAWATALATEISGYLASDDEYFQARSADLEDLRDRVLTNLAGGADETIAPGSVVVGEDMPPSRFLSIDWTAGGAIVLAAGSRTSHVAMLARSRGIPMVVAAGPGVVSATGEALVDGSAGTIVIDASASTREAFEARRVQEDTEAQAAAAVLAHPATTRDGTSVSVLVNIADPAELKALDPAHCDGIGLVRTEFLFQGRGSLPGEEAQFGVYRTIAEWAGGRPVTIRTLDAGGDKPIPGLTIDGESNPFLGVRGIRLSLARPEVFRVQLRALLRAAFYGQVKIMLPMVTIPDELEAARAMLAQEHEALLAAGRKVVMPQLGIMVEVPATALAVDRFDAAFFSIGSNDLTQYATAAGRDIGAVADLADPLHPGVLGMIEHVASYGAASGREVSLCGDAGGDPAVLPALLDAGLRAVSVAPAVLGRTKLAIAGMDIGTPRGGTA